MWARRDRCGRVVGDRADFVQVDDHTFDDGAEEIGLAGEMPVERALRHLRAGCDGVHPRSVEALLGELRYRRRDDRAALALALRPGPPTFHDFILEARDGRGKAGLPFRPESIK